MLATFSGAAWLIWAPSPDQGAAGAPSASECVRVLDVLVVDEDSGEPIPKARVKIEPPGGKQPRRGVTDLDGHLRLLGLCPGSARVVVGDADHAPATGVVELDEGITSARFPIAALHAHHSRHIVVTREAAPSTMATSEELAGARLAQTRGEGLADAISRVAGVATLRAPAGGMGKPIIRGQVGRRNLILVDGIRHEGQKWGLDHAPEVDPYFAGRITVVKGAATTRYGPDAIGGVVLLDPLPLPRTPGISGEASAVGFSNALGGGGSFRLDHAPAGAPGLAYRVDGNVTRTRASVTPDYALDNTGALTWNAGARVGYVSERFDMVAGYRLHRTRAGICTCLRVSTPEEFQRALGGGAPAGVDAYTPDFAIERPRQEVWHHLASLHSRVALGRGGELHALYAYQRDDREEFDRVRSGVTGPQLRFQLDTHTGELRWEQPAVALGKRWKLLGTVGADVSHKGNDYQAATTLIPDYQQTSGGAFAVERFVHERAELQVGARWQSLGRTAHLVDRDFSGQQAAGRLDTDACTAQTDGGGRCKHVFHAPSATLGVLARPSARLPFSLRLGLDSSARAPSIDEQYMNGSAPSFPILGLGDSHLGVERTWGGSLTVRYGGDWLLVEAAGYTNWVDHYIYFVPAPQAGECAPLTCTTRGPLPVFAFESVDAVFGGGEVRFEWETPRLPFTVRGNASWVRGYDPAGDRFIALVPPDRYFLAGRWRWPDTRVTRAGYLEIHGLVVDRRRHPDPDTDFAPPPPAYFLLGAGAGLEFPVEDHLIRLGLRGTNLLNRRYRSYGSLLRYFADEPGWSLQLRMSVEFDVSTG